MYKKNKSVNKNINFSKYIKGINVIKVIKMLFVFVMIIFWPVISTTQVAAVEHLALNEIKGDTNQVDNEEIKESLINEQLQSPEIEALKDYYNKFVVKNTGQLSGYNNVGQLIKDATKGEFKFNVKDILSNLTNQLFKEIYLNIHILLKLIVLIIICAILYNLQNSFTKDGVGELAFFACYIIIVSILVLGFKEAASFGVNVIEQMAGFMYATIPVLITLLISSGSITTGGIFQPILIMVVETSAIIIKNIFVPLIFISTSLSIVNNISEKLHLDKLADLLKKVGLVFIGTIMTMFIGFLAIQGPISAVADGVTNKTIKFALGTFIPIVGGYLADAADTVIGCTLLIKNAAGVVAMIGVISICIIPILKISAIALLYKITCAITEPISEKRITKCINDVANSIILILVAVAIVTLMFVISITVVIAAGNMNAMIR